MSIGGAPDDEHNLWPEPRNSEWNAAKKDQLEFVMYKMVCTNQISLTAAQKAMSENWIGAWKKYVPVHDWIFSYGANPLSLVFNYYENELAPSPDPDFLDHFFMNFFRWDNTSLQ